MISVETVTLFLLHDYKGHTPLTSVIVNNLKHHYSIKVKHLNVTVIGLLENNKN